MVDGQKGGPPQFLSSILIVLLLNCNYGENINVCNWYHHAHYKYKSCLSCISVSWYLGLIWVLLDLSSIWPESKLIKLDLLAGKTKMWNKSGTEPSRYDKASRPSALV